MKNNSPGFNNTGVIQINILKMTIRKACTLKFFKNQDPSPFGEGRGGAFWVGLWEEMPMNKDRRPDIQNLQIHGKVRSVDREKGKEKCFAFRNNRNANITAFCG